jgi:hypothetical protein
LLEKPAQEGINLDFLLNGSQGVNRSRKMTFPEREVVEKGSVEKVSGRK